MRVEKREYPPHCQMMRNALRSKEWEQDVVAAIMGQSRSTVNAILTGRQKLTARLAIDYGALLKVSPDELLRAQGQWELEMLPNMEAECAAIRLRVKQVQARIAGDIQGEIQSLQHQKAAIDSRIAHLTTVLETATPPQ